MRNYLELLKDIMDNGFDKDDRTGVGTRAVWGRMLRWNLEDGFPIVTTRKVALRIAFEETMFFLRGDRQTKKLENKNINIWKGNTTRKFLDDRGLTWLDEGDMGYGYGHQWRNFGGWDISDSPEGWAYNGVDQVTTMLDDLKRDPFSRRHIITAWNPQQLHGMALPPCHILHHYQVTPDGKLNSGFFMRSNDAYLGLPINIMGYAWLNIAFSKILNLDPGELVYMGTDVHLYSNQFDAVLTQLKREPLKLPKLVTHKNFNTFDELLKLEYTDIELINYKSHPALPKVDMAI